MRTHESGYIAIGAVLLATLAGLVVMSNQNRKTVLSVKSAEVKKLSLDAEELSLYGFSVMKQLLGDGSPSSPLRLANLYNPTDLQDIVLKMGAAPAGGSISLAGAREVILSTPDVVESSSSSLNAVFESGTFTSLDKARIPIQLQVMDFEPYPSGYGVRSLTLASQISLQGKGEKKIYRHYARIPVPLAGIDCKISVQGSDANSSTLLITKVNSTDSVRFNSRCSGDLIHAQLLINSIPAKDVSLPQSLNPLFSDHIIVSPGVYEARLQVTRVDDTVFDFGPVTVTLANPATAGTDYMKCLYKCTCEFPNSEPPTLCAGSTDFYNPFSPHVVPGKPLPPLNGNPEVDAASAKILEDWAYANGAVDKNDSFGPKIQGVLFPNNGYGRKLVCSKVGGGGGWDSYAFDPDNNCQEEFIGKRGPLGCLQAGTQILVGPGKMKAIEQLTKSDRIWNPIHSRYYEIEGLVRGPEKRELYRMTANGRSVTMTFDHPVLSRRGYLQAMELESGDFIWQDDDYVRVQSVERIATREGTEVWNLVVKNASTWSEHLIFADGMAVGDLWMQTELAKKQSHEK